jgi:hypothetical protein
MYKRQQSPSWWLPSGPAISNVTVEHGHGGLCPTQAVSGPHGAPQSPTAPREGARRRRPRVTALQAVANCQRFARVPLVLANAAAEKALAVTTRAQRRLRRGPHRTELAASWAALSRTQRQQTPARGAGGLPQRPRGTPAGCGKRGCVCQERSAGCEVSAAYDGSRSS